MSDAMGYLRELRLAGFNAEPKRGETPTIEFSYKPDSRRGIYLGLLAAIASLILTVVAILLWQPTKGAGMAFLYGLNMGLMVGSMTVLVYYVYPFFHTLALMLKHKKIPGREMLAPYSTAQRMGSCILLTLVVLYILNHGIGIVLSFFRLHPSMTSTYMSTSHYIFVSLGLAIGLNVLLPRILPKEPKQLGKKEKNIAKTPSITPENAPFGLWVGRSTGHLAQLWHRTGLATNQEMTLSTEDAAQNILVLGGIGSGKTTRLMQPLLAQLLDQGCGGLLFDVKGDVKNAASVFANHYSQDILFIGPNHKGLNLLAGLTPEIASSFLKSALLLSGGGHVDGFWVDTATELCRNTLGLLSFMPEHYTLQALYNYLFDHEFKEEVQEAINPFLASLEDSKEQRLLKSYLRYQNNVFSTFDEKVQSGVKATIAQALSPFNHPELTDAFCAETEEGLDMTTLLDGAVFLVDMPLARWGLGAKVAYTFIKLCFFNMMQNRIHNPALNQDRPVFFMCDEYQDLISASKDGLSDLTFWDKSRSSKTIGIISSQSVSSFYAAIGNHDLAHAVLQNFRQKFCFRTEDAATLTLMNNLAGQARVQRLTIGQSTTESDNGSSFGTSHSVTEAREAVLDAPLFRQLGQDQVIGLLSVNGHSMDDLFNLMPLYVEG